MYSMCHSYVVVVVTEGGVKYLRWRKRRTVFVDAMVDVDVANEKVATATRIRCFAWKRQRMPYWHPGFAMRIMTMHTNH